MTAQRRQRRSCCAAASASKRHVPSSGWAPRPSQSRLGRPDFDRRRVRKSFECDSRRPGLRVRRAAAESRSRSRDSWSCSWLRWHWHWTPSAGGSASPQGEARRERAAKPKQSAGRGSTLLTRVRVILGLRVGVGGRCNQTGTDTLYSPADPPLLLSPHETLGGDGRVRRGARWVRK